MTTDPRDAEIISLEKRFWEALRDGDSASAARLTDDPCLLTGAQGAALINPEVFSAMMNAPNWKLLEFEFENVLVTFPREDVAAVAYTVTEKLTVEGTPVTLHAADSSMWIHRADGWRCGMHTESILGDPFGRDKAKEP
jgi:hypothetical protein